jgi:hypothetical protein
MHRVHAGLLFLALPVALSGQGVRRLRAVDFTLPGIPDKADSSVVRRVLGAPDSTGKGDDPSQASGELPAWWYRDLQLIFPDGQQLNGWWITGPSRSTPRGLRIGAPRSDIRRLYGSPTSSSGDSTFIYREPTGGEHPRYLFISVAAGRVATIYVGRLID